MRHLRLIAIVGLTGFGVPAPATAETLARFDIRFHGLVVAEATVAGQETATAYAAAGRVNATGMAQIFARVRFDLQAEGARRDAGFRPARYRENVDTGQRASAVELRWTGDRPIVITQAPAPPPYAVGPESGRGTVDPMTALWRMLRDAAVAGAQCGYAVQVYDGARRSELILAPSEPDAGGVLCAGIYRRLDGFGAEAMADRDTFPFTAHYRPSNGLWRLTEVRATSLFGPIRIIRRD